ncbi:MAG: transglutaminase-like domain-containing protein [Methanobacterium sp.]|nr:transglutaminase-like domain-containing protein [Methanobacterium sp.]
MLLIPETTELYEYLYSSEIIDYYNINIQNKAKSLLEGMEDEIKLIKSIYEFVRDDIHHSMDIGEDKVVFKASDVLKYGHGLCFAKSNLLAALLRFSDIPAGYCYQKLYFEENLGLHGLNAVYLKNLDKWIRLDFRGNKDYVNEKFDVNREFLAYSAHDDGETDFPTIYALPNIKVTEIMLNSRNLTEALNKIFHTEWEL